MTVAELDALRQYILIALICLPILAALAWRGDPVCAECPHCAADKQRKVDEQKRLRDEWLNRNK